MEFVLLKDLNESFAGKEIRIKGTLATKLIDEETNPHLNVSVNDGTGKVMINLFNETKNSKMLKAINQMNPGAQVELRGVVKQVDASKNMRITFLKELTYISELVDYQGETFDMEKVRKYLNTQYKSLTPEYKDFLKVLLNKNPNFWSTPYSPEHYFSFNGGLACYTAKMLRLLEEKSKVLFVGDVNLLKALIFSHRIGKTKTVYGAKPNNVSDKKRADLALLQMAFGKNYEIDETKSGLTLEGHLTNDTAYSLGIVYAALEATNIPEDTKALIMHGVASSKMNAEWGAVEEPKLFEVRILNRLEREILEENEYKRILSENQGVGTSKGSMIKDGKGNDLYVPSSI